MLREGFEDIIRLVSATAAGLERRFSFAARILAEFLNGVEGKFTASLRVISSGAKRSVAVFK